MSLYLLCPEMAKLYRDIWEEKKAEFYVFKERKRDVIVKTYGIFRR